MGGSSSDAGMRGSVAASGSPAVTPSSAAPAEGSALLHRGVKREQVDRAFEVLGQRGENGGLVVDAGLLDGRAAEWAEFAAMGSSLPQFLQSMYGFLL